MMRLVLCKGGLCLGPGRSRCDVRGKICQRLDGPGHELKREQVNPSPGSVESEIRSTASKLGKGKNRVKNISLPHFFSAHHLPMLGSPRATVQELGYVITDGRGPLGSSPGKFGRMGASIVFRYRDTRSYRWLAEKSGMVDAGLKVKPVAATTSVTTI